MGWQSETRYGFRFLRSRDFPGLVIRDYYVTVRVKAGWGNPTHERGLHLWMVYTDPHNGQVDDAFKRVAQSGRFKRDGFTDPYSSGEDGFLRLSDAKATVTEYAATLAVVKFLEASCSSS